MTDFRALCAELLQELEHATDWDYQKALKDQARAALTQPEPEEPLYEGDQRWMFERDARQACRKKLLAIADELEAQ